MDPIHQFQITNLFTIGTIGGVEIALTNSALFMLIALAVIALLMIGATSPRAVVPGRLQAIAEISYEFIADTLRITTGGEGMKFFPLVFSIFMFILTVNLIGLIPYSFTVTSHIIITVAFALLVFLTVLTYGFFKHGFRFLKLFVHASRHQRKRWCTAHVQAERQIPFEADQVKTTMANTPMLPVEHGGKRARVVT